MKKQSITKSFIIDSLKLFGILIAISVMGSCAAKKELADLQSRQDSIKQELDRARLANQDLMTQTDNLNDQIEDMKSQLEASEQEKGNLQDQLNSAQSTIDELNARINAEDCPEEMVDGVVFRVQIGAYNQRDIPDDLDASVNLKEESEEELNKLVLGQFRDYYQADKLQKQLREMGVKGAWIVPYKDGKRVALEEVVDSVIN